MVKTTKAQRKALKRVFDRDFLRIEYLRMGPMPTSIGTNPGNHISYREFRSLVCPMFDRSGGIMIPWCGMWLGIETDGYCHS